MTSRQLEIFGGKHVGQTNRLPTANHLLAGSLDDAASDIDVDGFLDDDLGNSEYGEEPDWVEQFVDYVVGWLIMRDTSPYAFCTLMYFCMCRDHESIISA